MNQQEIEILSKKYLSGELNREEVKRLKELVAKSDNSTLNDSLQQLWDNCTQSGKRNTKAFNEISGNLKVMFRPAKQRNIGWYVWRGVAAILLPLLLLSTAYLLVEKRSVNRQLNAEFTINAEKGERASIVLPDGTIVCLNAQTSLSYPASFALDNRTVKLTGEAYFEVTHDPGHPFVVQTPKADVKVLGTSFNLYAYPDDIWFETALVNGKVEVSFTGIPGKRIVLNPRQKIRYNSATGEINVSNTDLKMETAWRRGDLIFRSATIQDVIMKIESFYGARISIEGNLPDELLTGSYHEDDITMVLTNLQQHYHFTFRKSGDKIYLKFK